MHATVIGYSSALGGVVDELAPQILADAAPCTLFKKEVYDLREQEDDERLRDAVVRGGETTRPCRIIGDTGVGKTHWAIRYLIVRNEYYRSLIWLKGDQPLIPQLQTLVSTYIGGEEKDYLKQLNTLIVEKQDRHLVVIDNLVNMGELASLQQKLRTAVYVITSCDKRKSLENIIKLETLSFEKSKIFVEKFYQHLAEQHPDQAPFPNLSEEEWREMYEKTQGNPRLLKSWVLDQFTASWDMPWKVFLKGLADNSSNCQDEDLQEVGHENYFLMTNGDMPYFSILPNVFEQLKNFYHWDQVVQSSDSPGAGVIRRGCEH